MSKVLLTHSYFLKLDQKQWRKAKPYPPLATLYGASVLRRAGHEVQLFDSMFSDPAYISSYLDKFQPDYLVIYDDGFNYLTKMCLTNMRHAAFEMAKSAKSKNIPVIISGSDATDRRIDYLKEGIDFVVIGEAEATIEELIDALSNKKPYQNIRGLAWTESGELKESAPRPVMRQIDNIPHPAWDLVDIEKYRSVWMKNNGYFSLNAVSTRGCPFKCNWCAKPIYGNRYNCHSPEYMVEELKLLTQEFGASHIWFCDDIFGLKPGWMEQFSELVKTEGLEFKYDIQCRVDLLEKEETIKALADSGCNEIWMGVESGSQKILDAMDKGIKLEQVYAVTPKLKAYGMKPAFFLQFGYLDENKEDIAKTLDMLFELMPYDIGVSVSYPLPGTVFYEKVKEQMSDKTNWKDSDELELMYHNTYPPGFYKALHRFIHKKFRQKQAENIFKDLFRSPAGLTSAKFKRLIAFPFYLTTAIIARFRMMLYLFRHSDVSGKKQTALQR